jgi:hypothetical protein
MPSNLETQLLAAVLLGAIAAACDKGNERASSVTPPASAPPVVSAVPAARPTTSSVATPRKVTYRCTKGAPTSVRGGCLCGDEIVNPCFDKAHADIPQSPDFTVEGDACIFSCD